MNKMSNSPIKMPLKGLAIGDGLCDPPNQMDYGDFLYQVGLLDEADRNVVQMHSKMAKIAMGNEQWHLASPEFNAILEIVENKTGLAFYYNYLLSTQPPEFKIILNSFKNQMLGNLFMWA